MILEKRCVGMVNKRAVKEVFTKIFKSQLEIVIRITLDEKKKDQLKKELTSDLAKKGDTEAYQKIISAIDVADLNIWATQVANELAVVYKAEKAKAATAASNSYFSYSYWTKKKEDPPPESSQTDSSE